MIHEGLIMSRVSRRSKPQTQLRLPQPDRKRLATLARQAGLPMAEIIGRLLYRAAHGKLSAEARRYLALVREITTPPPGAMAQQRAALKAHRFIMEGLVRRADGAPDLLVWNRWVTTADTLRKRASEPAAKHQSSSKTQDASERPRSYEEHLEVLLEAQKREQSGKRQPQKRKPAITVKETKPLAAVPVPAPASVFPRPEKPQEKPAGQQAQGVVGSNDTTGNFPVQDAERAARDVRARWL